MARIIEALKELGKKLNTGGTAPTGETVDEVINSIAEDFDITGATGADGASVTAIELELTERRSNRRYGYSQRRDYHNYYGNNRRKLSYKRVSGEL